MNLEELKTCCLSRKGATSDFPFDDVTMVFRVAHRMFALVRIDQNPLKINLKCDPLMAQDLRMDFPAITPGYHMNKKYWITITFDGTLSDGMVKNLISNSYTLVYEKLTRKEKESLLDAKEIPSSS